MLRKASRRPLRVSLVSPGVLLALSTAAFAASVSNRDDTDHKVTIIEEGAQTDHVLKKGASLEGICLKGCTIRINDDDVNPYELDGSEITTIEGGDLYAERPGSPISPDSGGFGQPSAPRSQP